MGFTHWDWDLATGNGMNTGAIIGDGDRKRSPFLVLGLTP